MLDSLAVCALDVCIELNAHAETQSLGVVAAVIGPCAFGGDNARARACQTANRKVEHLQPVVSHRSGAPHESADYVSTER